MEKPLMPYSAYLIFFNQERPKIKAESPGLNFADAAKLLGERWRNMPEQDKEKYQQEAAVLKANYDLEMEKWNANQQQQTAENDDDKNEVDSSSDIDEDETPSPQMPPTPYYLFMLSVRDTITREHPTLGKNALIEKMREMWGAMTEDQKAPFAQQSQQLWDNYHKEMDARTNQKSAGTKETKERRGAFQSTKVKCESKSVATVAQPIHEKTDEPTFDDE